MSEVNPPKVGYEFRGHYIKTSSFFKSYYHDDSFYQNCEARYPMRLEIR